VLSAFAAPLRATPPLHDTTALNIGLNCQWQQRCITTQTRAMQRSLKFVRKYQPPVWRVQLCNRNAARQRYRVDWIGFDNCIRNAVLSPLPARAFKVPASAPRKRVKRLTQSAPPPPPAPSAPGERGR
jgi:hypothetical protein